MHILQHYTVCTIGYYGLSYYLLEYQADRYLSSVGKLIACKLFDIISLFVNKFPSIGASGFPPLAEKP